MEVLFAGVLLMTICFGGVLLFGAPYLPTLNPQIIAALDLLELQPGDTILELGCGDGKVLAAAAERGLKAIGYELNPILVMAARWRTRHCRDKVKVVWGNFWHHSWPESNGVFVFLLDRFMGQLDTRMQDYGGKLVSVAFRIPGRKPTQERHGVFYYEYKPGNKKTAKGLAL